MQLRKFIKLCIPLILIFCMSNPIFAYSPKANFYISPDCSFSVKGESFNLNLNVEANSDINISTFRLKINFDDTKLKYTGIYSNYGSDDFKVYVNGGKLTIIYLTSDYGVDVQANSPTCLASIGFKSISGVESCQSKFIATVDGVGNYDVMEISSSINSDANINIVDAAESNCNLKSIYAQGYDITPEFNADITQYYTTVPSNISSLEVSAVPQDSGASVSVSRKKLNAAGKTTDITITVKGSDEKSKKVYTLTVLRKDNDLSNKGSTSSSNKSGGSSNYKDSSKSGGESSKSSDKSLDDNQVLLESLSGINILKNNFNFLLFFVISSICIVIVIFIMRRKQK